MLYNSLRQFSSDKHSNYRYIKPSKWYRLPKKLQSDIRSAEQAKDNKRIISLYKKVDRYDQNRR